MKLQIVNNNGESTGKEVELDNSIFGVEPNDHAIYLDVKQYMAHQRQGTHKSKDKSEINASTKKLKRQKGTGTARAGSAKSGVMIGGGRMHGPRPRTYGFKLNKKLKDVARRSALSYKAKDNQIIVLDQLSFGSPSTKECVAVLNKLKVMGRFLLVTSDVDKNVYLSARNIPNAEVLPCSDINTYSILKAKNVIFTEDAVNKLSQNFNEN
ncbi:MAG: 50S ribosomal protein L4 [Flavobacteriales bacterium]|nr:50S ribosomal protein L4 [Flavobacteriales bacterium]